MFYKGVPCVKHYYKLSYSHGVLLLEATKMIMSNDCNQPLFSQLTIVTDRYIRYTGNRIQHLSVLSSIAKCDDDDDGLPYDDTPFQIRAAATGNAQQL